MGWPAWWRHTRISTGRYWLAELTVREANDEDIPGILDTLRAALGESPLLRRTPELWAWKHVHNPFGESLVLVAQAGGRIAGVRAMMRWSLEAPDGTLLECLRPVDTATHPDFARRGVFRQLTMTALDKAREEGVQLVFNTPNDKSAPGYLSMGWRQVAPVGVLVRPRLGATVRPNPEEAPSIRMIAPGADPATEVPSSASFRPARGLRTPRRPDYMEWRYRAHPTASYGWIPENGLERGAVVRASYRGSRAELVVSDLVGSPSPAVIKRAALAARTRYLAGWFSPGSPERRTAVRGGMLPVPGVRTLRLVAKPLVDLATDVFDLGSWDLSTSDLELL